ncbi:prepilin-type N-terminal cleavage/methylation domain-containing protein [Phormidesmis priestleyi ULC007]|uniref:Prepilin-type N-terminal cleavage/methylation domain-containing protein n=1 Tax=Phormidesmis priestleyi ULC007 TaxID=1920490 RepID=A0A2T1DBZ8_9CYAN|nr:prepilin-type N-terminal cleavage/methylation domain-containing protein [Phormidesmis priestleyi]PSB17983.1 prepilin-type N-terminal cleavage/methylation domain-containing protein [Phormidesmis priestleyi ULC007]PZO49323.1 MAG: prepilin-type N-terminal cleavage/methylation domain-containing protein [Phormidesmis priestleyi]
MARKWFKQGSQRLRLSSKRRKSAGFTLIELLVAMFIGGVITSILLFLVVQLLQTSQRESARSDTQREMQMALDYIGRDLREAVYVYDGNCLTNSAYSYPSGSTCSGLLKYLPTAGADNLPVLAFWRVDPLPPDIDKLCQKNATAFSEQDKAKQDAALIPISGIPCVSRRMYTLVVYSLDSKENDKPWSGRARIKRYQLPQYIYSADTKDKVTSGWSFPAGGDVSFMSWPLDAKGKEAPTRGTPISNSSNTQVLVDFVDQKGLSVDQQGLPNGTLTTNAVCPSVPVTNPVTPGYVLTPSSTDNRGFYVCVKGAESNGNLNQEVSIFLQGNAAGRPGLPLTTSNVPISMQTRVMTRGSLDKRI